MRNNIKRQIRGDGWQGVKKRRTKGGGSAGEGMTYRRAFFFGPGRPRTRATGSDDPLPRLLPGLGPGIPFRRGVSPGVTPVAGVEVTSALDSTSADGRATGASTEEAGEDCSALSGRDEGSGVLVSEVS